MTFAFSFNLVLNFKNIMYISPYHYNAINNISNVLMRHYVASLICWDVPRDYLKINWNLESEYQPSLETNLNREKKLSSSTSSFLTSLSPPPPPYPTLIFTNPKVVSLNSSALTISFVFPFSFIFFNFHLLWWLYHHHHPHLTFIFNPKLISLDSSAFTLSFIFFNLYVIWWLHHHYPTQTSSSSTYTSLHSFAFN